MLKIFAAMTLALVSGNALSHTTEGDSATALGFDRAHLGDFVSEPGEALVDFLRRTGAFLHTFTRDTGHEGCGAIGSNGAQFSVRLYSDGVPHGCAVRSAHVVSGHEWTGETLHSHPWQQVLHMDAKARAWDRHYRVGQAGAATLRNSGASGFSRADFAGGPGWLVAKGQLMHQAGVGTVTKHGTVSLVE